MGARAAERRVKPASCGGDVAVTIAKLVAALTLALALACPAAAQPAAQGGAPSVKVATRIVPPFVFKKDGELTGFSIDLWRALAREMKTATEFVETGTLPELLAAVGDRRADLAIAAISITAARERVYDFSHPMFDAGLQIMVPAERGQSDSNVPGILGLLFSRKFAELVVLLLLLMLVPAPLIWWLERRHDNEFVRSNTRVGEALKSLWWSGSTLAGQATEMPRSALGRVIALMWMLTGVVFVSYFTASVTAALTVQQLEQGISGPQDLAGKTVATVAGSTSAAYLRNENIETVETPAIGEAIEALRAGRAQAVVYDAPVLLYYAAHEGKGKVRMTGPIFRPESYGILFPSGSTLRKELNAALLRLKESGEYRTIHRKWFTVEDSGK
jgi:polar amino acid transport system substrate-binding protein